MGMRTLLKEEIQNEFTELKKTEIGSDAYKTTVDGLTKLVDRAIELEKFDAETREKDVNRAIDNDLKREQMKDEKKDRIARNGIAIAGIVIPTAVTIWGTFKSLKFEETGTITTGAGRAFINRLFPKK